MIINSRVSGYWQMVMGGDLTWPGEHPTQCTDDVLWNCAPEVCILLLTSATPKHLI